jgi:hypothetical protein
MLKWFKAKQPEDHPLRANSLRMSAKELGLQPSAVLPRVYGLLMDQKIAGTGFTLAAFGEGSVSLYWGANGGIIGAGEHESVLAKAEQLLALAQEVPPSSSPSRGDVEFCFKAFEGDFTVSADTQALFQATHPLHSLYMAAQDVITEIRLLG